MNKQTMVCPVKFKSVEGKDNYITGIASVFGNVDEGDDIVHQGAFVKTVAERVPKRLVKFVDSHTWNCMSTLGTVEEAREVESGLFFGASISKAPSAQDTKIKMTEGHIDKLSFGYDIVKKDFETVNGKTIRNLRELKLLEISACPLAMNEQTSILSVKKMESKVVDETEHTIRVQVDKPDKFDDGTYKTISIDAENGISALIGKYKSDIDGPTHVQTYIFKKDNDWTKEKAVKWVEEHQKILSHFGIKEIGLICEPLMIAEPGKDPLTIDSTYDIKARDIGLRLALQKQNIT